MSTQHTTSDLAADSPLTYDELKAAHRAGGLGALLLAMTPRERIGAAAVNAERTGREVSAVLDRFDALMVEAQRIAALDADAAPRRAVVAALTAQTTRDAVRAELAEYAEMTGLPAYERALEDLAAGATWRRVAGGWVVTRDGGEPHLVNADGRCGCRGGRHFCRHAALVDGVRAAGRNVRRAA